MGVKSRESPLSFSLHDRKNFKELQAQWETYHSTTDPALKLKCRNELLENCLPLVARAVRHVWKREREPPRNSDVDDLFCETVRLLLSAHTLDRFDPSLGVSFVTYFGARSVLRARDSIRELRQGSRHLRKRRRWFESATEQLLTQLERQPTSEEIFEGSGLSKVKRENVQSDWWVANPVSLTGLERFGVSVEDSFLGAQRESLKDAVLSSLGVDSRFRTIVLLHYYRGMNLEDIGDLLGITESRVSQLCARAVQILKRKFHNRVDEFVLC